MKSILGALYRGWMRLAQALGRIQTFLVLSIIYVAGVGLMAPLLRLFSGDPLDRRLRPGGSAWIPRRCPGEGLEQARRMF